MGYLDSWRPLRPRRDGEVYGLASTLARYSADEMVAAAGLARAPAGVRAAVRAGFLLASAPLGRVLARFDERVSERGIDEGAAAALDDLGARWTRVGELPKEGALLVVANHPGAYDALVLLAALGRRDVAIIAADRVFLRALPAVSRHLIFIPDDERSPERAVGLRQALRHLSAGGALLHFGAGHIEPDPAFVASVPVPLDTWGPGTGTLARAALRARGQVAAAVVLGVHSPRAKRLWVTRLAERYGMTTLAPLLQVVVPTYRDVVARVLFSKPTTAETWSMEKRDDATLAQRVRALAAHLLREECERAASTTPHPPMYG